MKKMLFIFIFYHSAFILGSAQQTNLDSLYSVWQDKTQSDSTRVEAYKDYIWDGFLFSNPDSAFLLAEDLHGYAEKHNYSKASALGYNLQGNIRSNQGNYPSAIIFLKKSFAIHNEIEDKRGIAFDLNDMGMIYQNTGNSIRALEYFEKSLVIHEEIGEKKGIGMCLINIGIIYSNQGNIPQAMECYEKSLAMMEEIGEKTGIASTLINMALVYYNQNNYARCLEYSKKSLVISEEIRDKHRIALNLNNIGYAYYTLGKTSMALDYSKRGLELAEENNDLEIQKYACESLYEIYKTIGNGNEALVYLEKLNVINDSLQVEETAKKLEQMEFAKIMLQDSIARAETDRLVLEAHQEEMRKEEKTRNISFGVGAFLLLLAGGLYTRVRYIRKSRANLQVEKDRSENLLLNILPEEIARELKEKGKADARDFDMVSILFTDFKGFTEQSAKLSASDLVNEINHCFEAFDGIMEKYGIEKIKTIGDAYMAAGGLPVPTDDSVKNTVLAAIEMQDFIIRRKAEKNAKEEPAFEMRVGIHTGPVVAGIVGVKKFQYDIWGDTVNTASRMESSSEVGKVNISQASYELLKSDPDFTFESRGKIEAKGKGEIEMLFVTLKK